MSIEEQLASLDAKLDNLPAATAAAVVAALPAADDQARAVAALQDSVTNLVAGQTLEESHIEALQSAVASVQETLGAPPSPPPPNP